MRDKIAQYLRYNPRNKLIFTPTIDPHLQCVDVGFKLASLIKEVLSSPYLPMITEEMLGKILKESTNNDDIIGEYVAISNWGILFEPELKLNLLSLFDSYSKNQTLILVNCGEFNSDRFHLVSTYFNTVLPLGQLTPCIIRNNQ